MTKEGVFSLFFVFFVVQNPGKANHESHEAARKERERIDLA